MFTLKSDTRTMIQTGSVPASRCPKNQNNINVSQENIFVSAVLYIRISIVY